MKLPTLSSPLKLFAPAPAGPALGAAGATGGHMMFASSGNGGRGGYDDDDIDYENDYVDEPPMDDQEPEEPRQRPRSRRTVRATAAGGGATGGQPRVAQHQPEERYWTDYLRIALPVVGILLMLGLLWYWATMLIGDSPEPTDPEEEQIGLVSEGTPTPTNAPAQVQDGSNAGTQGNTIGIGDTASTPQSEPGVTTQPPADGAGTDNQAQAPEEEAPAEEPAGEDTGELFAGGDPVVVTEDGVNVRPDAGTAGDPISVVNSGDELTIASGPVEAEGYVWWEVILPDASSGWIVEDYITPAE